MAELTLTGANYIGGTTTRNGTTRFRAFARAEGKTIGPDFAEATSAELEAAAGLAAEAFPAYSWLPAEARAGFLEEIALQIEALGDPLLLRASEESGLPLPRLTGERGRTTGQLRMFANLLREGSWVDVRIEHADPARSPLPKPELRRMLVPIGPVAVFGASNFPLAFSVAGGDTASALAAGCPVIVKAHPAHPGTSEMVARAVIAAAEATGMPAGVFAMIHGGVEVGQALVKRPEIYAVGFTGSQAAGRALFDIAAARPRPIPVYAEMGSVNPVFVLEGANAQRGDALADGYADSLTLGVGQFCTNPGVLVGMAGEPFENLVERAGERIAGVAPGLMLTEGITNRYASAAAERSHDPEVSAVFAEGDVPDRAKPKLYKTTGRHFLSHPELAEEVFGPSGIAVACASFDEMKEVAKALEGQLTTSLQMEEIDTAEAQALLPLLIHMAGRIVFNGFPTGVEVNTAMQHGGPYPATTDSRSTSVGTAAILRFARPVVFQNAPEELLPEELRLPTA